MTAGLIIKGSHCNEMLLLHHTDFLNKTSLYNRISFCFMKSDGVLLKYSIRVNKTYNHCNGAFFWAYILLNLIGSNYEI